MANEKQDKAPAADAPGAGQGRTEFGRTMGGAAAHSPQERGARDMWESAKDTAGAQGEAVVEWIKARPVTSFAIGAALGALIGYAIGRRVG